jgi:hypothetical protein
VSVLDRLEQAMVHGNNSTLDLRFRSSKLMPESLAIRGCRSFAGPTVPTSGARGKNKLPDPCKPPRQVHVSLGAYSKLRNHTHLRYLTGRLSATCSSTQSLQLAGASVEEDCQRQR